MSNDANPLAEAALHNAMTITRVFNAPPEVVFRAWADAEQLQRWWGPHGFTNPVCEVDARPGGAMRIHMCGPDGSVYPMSATFREVIPPERLVFISVAMAPDETPLFEVLNTVTFLALDGNRTQLTVEASPFNIGPDAAPYLSGMQEGWTQSLERLQAFVSEAAAS